MEQPSESNVNNENDDMSSFSALQTINTDCLIHIFAHLDIMDVINLTATCTTLLNFAKAEFFPKKARQICLYMSDETDVLLKAPLINGCRPRFTLQGLETAFCYFGEFVDDLTLNLTYQRDRSEKDKLWRSSAILLDNCKFLKTLRFRHWSFTPSLINALHEHIERFENLNELDLLQCDGITNNWPPALQCKSKVDKITLNGANQITANFVEYFSNLSSLTIDFAAENIWKIDDVARIFNKNGHCLTHLKLVHLVHTEGYESIRSVIVNNLPKLENFSLQFDVTDNTKSLIALPHLKSLEIVCDKQNINTLLRTLSNNGIIEEITMTCGFFDDKDEPPLIFNKLRSFCWCFIEEESNFLTAMTKSQMPEIHTFDVYSYTRLIRIHEDDLLKFIESKKTLKSMHFEVDMLFDFSFLRQLIAILKKPSPAKRPTFELSIPIAELAEEEVR